MIDQAPREISVASLESAKRVKTALGTYAIHRLPPALFGGWDERDGVKLARPEKALFDLAYVSAVHGARPRRVPELELPAGFDRDSLAHWLSRVESPRPRARRRSGWERARLRRRMALGVTSTSAAMAMNARADSSVSGRGGVRRN